MLSAKVECHNLNVFQGWHILPSFRHPFQTEWLHAKNRVLLANVGRRACKLQMMQKSTDIEKQPVHQERWMQTLIVWLSPIFPTINDCLLTKKFPKNLFNCQFSMLDYQWPQKNFFVFHFAKETKKASEFNFFASSFKRNKELVMQLSFPTWHLLSRNVWFIDGV